MLFRIWVPVLLILAAVIVVITQWPRSDTSSPYVFIESFVLLEPDAFDDRTLELIRESKTAADRGDLESSLNAMKRAVAHHHETPNPNFELWDNLAELYCATARTATTTKRAAELRSKGMALLREFRCGVDLWDLKQECRDIVDRNGMCFRTLCTIEAGYATGRWDAFMDAEPAPGSFTWHTEDSQNVDQIEKACR